MHLVEAPRIEEITGLDVNAVGGGMIQYRAHRLVRDVAVLNPPIDVGDVAAGDPGCLGMAAEAPDDVVRGVSAAR